MTNANQISLVYQPKKGGWAIRIIEPSVKTVHSVISHFRVTAELRRGNEKIGEVYWHEDKCSDCWQRLGHDHWCFWYDPEQIELASKEVRTA